MSEAYKTINYEGNSGKYHTGEKCVEGCGNPAGTAWSPYWCVDCNIKRMDKLDRQFSALAESYGIQEAK